IARRHARAVAAEAVRGPVAARREVVLPVAFARRLAHEELAARVTPELVAALRRLSGRRACREHVLRVADDAVTEAQRTAFAPAELDVDPLDLGARRIRMTGQSHEHAQF